MMNRNVHSSLRRVAFLTLLISGCAPRIAPYSERAYENATRLKAEALVLMDRATTSYRLREPEIQQLSVRVQAAYEYANGLPNNQLSAEQWRMLIAPDELFLGGYFALWQRQDTLMQGDIDAAKTNVRKAFDEIIRLEAAKIRK